MTIAYYDKNGQEFAERTQHLDASTLYQPFLGLVPENGHLLDAGCDSGRDTRAFLERGYKVTAIDASETMVTLATRYTGQPVLKMRFKELSFCEVFDGIWACASLLHVPRHELECPLG
jgi:SAM-dependent methyltransferase